MTVLVLQADAARLPLPDVSVDAVVTDPPYGLEFMGKDWDRPWAVGMSTPGYSDAERLPRPAFNDNRNANCRRCGGRARGERRCLCPTPDWDRAPAEDMRAFQAWCELWAREAWRVLKPGGYLLAFGGTRTYHRLTCAIEDAGFEIRDSITWLYGSGFPKSLDVSKAIDKAAGAERASRNGDGEHEGTVDFAMKNRCTTCGKPFFSADACACPRQDKVAVTDAAKQWQGWGTALKPASEPIVVARKPFPGTVAQNVTTHGTGALNIDGCRTPTGEQLGGGASTKGSASHSEGWDRPWKNDSAAVQAHAERVAANVAHAERLGRWPANVVLSHLPDCEDTGQLHRVKPNGSVPDGSGPRRNDVYGTDGRDRDGWTAYQDAVPVMLCAPGCPVALLDEQSGRTASPGTYERSTIVENHVYGASNDRPVQYGYRDQGGASRFFPVFRYEAKAGGWERPTVDGVQHPTVKPRDLIRWLIRLVTPPGGRVLDMFAGSGTTGEAARLERLDAILIERDQEYLRLIQARLARPVSETRPRPPVVQSTGQDALW